MSLFKTIFFALAFMVFTAPVFAANVGDEIPHNLKVKDQHGEKQSFESLSAEKGAVLIFVRSADWCPYCQVQLLDLKFDGDPIREAGYEPIIISYDSVEVLKRFTDKYEYPYTMLSDKGSEIIKAFGILNEEIAPESDRYGIPKPTVFVVSKDGIITHILGDGSVRNRADIDAIMAVLAPE